MPSVTFDRHSFLIDGERVLLQCGAFHYFRLPAPTAWPDALLRLRRAGYNAVDLYFPWHYHSPAPGVYDFTGIRDVPRLLRLVDQVGLYLVARPGPYICAEVDAGGLPGWLLAQQGVIPRCRHQMRHAVSPAYLRYVEEWYEQIIPLILQCNGLVMFQIENEYFTEEMGDEPAYMQFLYDLARRLGVTVPIMHNDALLPLLGGWQNVVDVTTVDLYPVNFANMATWRQEPDLFFNLDSLAESWAAAGLDCPIGLGEFQGGWFDGWGGPGYEALRAALGEDYHRLLVGSALGQGATFYNLYMFHGGTTWGFWGEPGVYTSYDYAAPVGEAGTLTRRYYQARRLALTAAVLAPVLTNATPTTVALADPELLYAARTDGRSTIIFLRNLTATEAQTRLTGPGDGVPVTIPAYGLRLVPLNLPLGPTTLAYSTAEPVLHHVSGNHRLLILARNPGQDDHTLVLPPAPGETGSAPVPLEAGEIDLHWSGDAPAAAHLYLDRELLHILALPPHLAERVWPTGDLVFIGADYVGAVRDLPDGLEAEVEMAAPGQVHIWSPRPVQVQVNGQPRHTRWSQAQHLNTLPLPGPEAVSFPRRGRGGKGEHIPALGPWEVSPGSPERLLDFDDADWQPIPPGAPLHMDAQGLQRGLAWYRGHLAGLSPQTRLTLSVEARHSCEVFLNGTRLAVVDNLSDGPAMVIPLPPELLRPDSNLLAVLVESLGHNKGFAGDENYPCGLLTCRLEPDQELAWRVRGGLTGGHAGTPDSLTWRNAPRQEQDPAVVWYRTWFTLNLPAEHRVPVGLSIRNTPGKVFIYLNGLLVGRYWEVGPQTLFYLPDGVLRLHERNELALAHWRRGPRVRLGPVSLMPYPAYRRFTLRVQYQ